MTVNNNYSRFTRSFAMIIFLFIIYVVLNNYYRNHHRHDNLFESFFNGKLNSNESDGNIKFSQDYIRGYLNSLESQLDVHWLRVIKHYIKLPLENGYGSHKLALLAASVLTDGGPVIEMGCGYHSTVLLHEILVKQQKRYLLSTDTDQEWLSKFQANMSSSMHPFRHIKTTPEWNTVGIDRPRWSFIFVDQKPGERRVIDIIRLENVSDIIIVHDTEASGYNYEPGLSRFPYRYRYNYLSTYTDVVSKHNGTLLKNIQHLLELTIKWKLPKET
jgi:hypothetical protein